MYGHMRVILSCRFRKQFYFKREWAGPGGGYYYVEPYFDNKLYYRVSNPSQLRKCRILSMIQTTALNQAKPQFTFSLQLMPDTTRRDSWETGPMRGLDDLPAGFRYRYRTHRNVVFRS